MQIRGRAIGDMNSLLALMEQQLAAFDRAGDHRAVFLRVYTRMTRRVQERTRGDFFLDPSWLEQVAIRFAAYYFAALDAHAAGRPCPPAWQRAFAAAAQRRSFVLQDVLLGINAHINNDLPQVLADVLAAGDDWPVYPRLVRRRFDHDQVNRILHELIPIVEGEVARHHARLLGVLGRVLGRLDDLLAIYGLKYYRSEVWHKAGFLLAAAAGVERERVRRCIEQDALALARQIEQGLAPRWLRWLAPLTRRWRLA